jgi:hypothetical protein
MDNLHWIFQDFNDKGFLLFNDSPLSDEPVSDADMQTIEIDGDEPRHLRSCAWSSGVNWLFVIRAEDILLLNVGSIRGVLCRKKSYKFIEAFIEAPVTKRGRVKG